MRRGWGENGDLGGFNIGYVLVGFGIGIEWDSIIN
jgi:hypothetical protein